MFTLNCNGRLLVITQPIVMGIINVTPDSFYANSRTTTVTDVLRQAEKMLADGATILDIGGMSTRPGSIKISEDDELIRVLPCVIALTNEFPEAFLSIDTYQSNVAKACVDAGVHLINDISGGSLDENMLQTVANCKVTYVCMHMKGSPQNMQQLAAYEHVTKEVLDYFIRKLHDCKEAGIHDVIIDPGFGFAKTIEHNFKLLRELEIFKILQKPLLIGISRKATIYKTLNITSDEALNGTTVLNTIAINKGANILRVHDVKEAMEVIKLSAHLN